MRRPLLVGSALLAAAALLLPAAPASAGALAASTVAPVAPVAPTPVLPPTEGPLPVVPKPKPVVPKPVDKPKPVVKPKPVAKPKPVVKPRGWTPTWQGALATGTRGPAVKQAQLRLTALGYWAGPANGRFGPQTTQAVLALQKTVGLPRTGRLDRKVRNVLIAGIRPRARTRSGTTLEIDIRRQLLFVVVNGRTTLALNTSTGSGRAYYQDGNRYISRTPRGRFGITRQINGRRVSKLGVLWRPKYFSGGYAMHGSSSIPGYAASHGCARLSNPAINFLWSAGLAPVGRRLWIY